MRGQRRLFDNLIIQDKGAAKKGRSGKLISRRDDLLAIRYYYHTEVKRLRFDDVLRVLSEDEFFIETQTILNRLACLGNSIKEIFKNKPSLSKLKEMSGNFVVEVTAKEKERYEKCM